MADKLSKKKGFTLVEILIVISIISMIILLGVSSYGVVRKKIRLDIAANSFQSTIVEARDKAKAGYYEDAEGDVANARSICFGFLIEKDGLVTLETSQYNRLAQKGAQCDTKNTKKVINLDQDPDIVVKNLYLYGDEIQEDYQVFFAPPDGNIEYKKPTIIQDDPELIAILGYSNSDEELNKRVVIFNLLTGSSYTETFTQYENEQ